MELISLVRQLLALSHFSYVIKYGKKHSVIPYRLHQTTTQRKLKNYFCYLARGIAQFKSRTMRLVKLMWVGFFTRKA